ncbi:MAG TPA: carboxypeptidase-like regulatory domain-containing protein [Bacteroidia bacterium]|jgi:hypothetical protein|nr:carboxypeptidase-like regulatory domain-containing protein [Bacteroidia bacterium]
MNKYKIYSVFFLFLIFISCKKEGTGGKAQISGFVIYNGTKIPGATVYIKYGATTSPGDNPANYDSQQTADSQGNFVFGSLVTGNYYLFAIGHYTNQNSISGPINVTGGTAAKIPHTKSTVNYDIAVK